VRGSTDCGFSAADDDSTQMAITLSTPGTWTIRLATALLALAAAVAVLSMARPQQAHTQPAVSDGGISVANGHRDVVRCGGNRTVAYVDRSDSASNCEAVVLHVTSSSYLR
jgi:hypothetical protein